ncbi:exodeoxyribonuclease VII large subunit, partial [Acinetobacter baumannii]|uniref:exodeoxyribonuclease VII large subunit n=1 Tax=Acinetobacter baumannii TaxID=470 RepID=UPI001D171F1C
MSDPQLSLSEYLGTVQEVIRLTFDEPVWVRAEIRNLNVKGGHYYLELAEALLHKDLKCKAPLIEPNLRRNLGKW